MLKSHRLSLVYLSAPSLGLLQFSFVSCAPSVVECRPNYWDPTQYKEEEEVEEDVQQNVQKKKKKKRLNRT